MCAVDFIKADRIEYTVEECQKMDIIMDSNKAQ